MRELNLARHPFVNLRPVRRAGLLLLLVALGLFVVNALLYWEHFTGEGQTRSRSQELARLISEQEVEIEGLRREIANLDIDGLNSRTRFVNLEIDRRRFAWSRLFDRIAQVQPDKVRLLSMTPRFGDDDRMRSRTRIAPDEIGLKLRGVAKSGEQILEFIDRLFEHPAFRDPDLSRESRRQDGMLNFDLSVLYLPGADEAPASLTAAEDEALEAGSDTEEEDEA